MKKILIVLAVAFILIQLFPIDKTNPPIDKKMDFLVIKKTPDNLSQIIQSSCYDCHSNESKYPWYSSIAPVSWWLKKHIDEGRKELNFSTFATYEPKKQAHKLEECAEMIENGEMPLESYTLAHSEAKLSNEQKEVLITYFKKTQAEIMAANNLTHDDLKKKIIQKNH